ncbi:MAG: radical SAM protein [Deltaproteobacteria bacterium]|nr:radical SAM protein [Deltaproteobacteria bacterium]
MHVILFLNHSCNLACTYCYNGKKFDSPLSYELIEKGIDLAFTRGDVRITFFGGEPLLEFERIQYAVAYAKKKKLTDDQRLLRFCTTVNGTLLDAEKMAYFKKEDFFVAVSMDGVAAACNLNRRYPDGAPAYDDIVRGAERVKQTMGKVALSAVVDPSNVNWMAESFAHVIALGAYRFSFNFNYDAHWDEPALAQYKSQMKRVTQHYVNAYRAGNAIDYSTFTSKIRSHLNDGLQSKCKFGEGELTLAPSGRLYPCERLVGEDTNAELCIGHIDTGINLEKVLAFKRARLHKDADCSSCAVEHRCVYFCGCINYATTGTIGTVSSLLCEVEQTNIAAADEAASILYAEQNPAFLKRIYLTA